MMKQIAGISMLVSLFVAVPALAAQKIKLVERPIDEKTIDLGAKGDSIGDLLVFGNPIFDAANKIQLGTDQGFCVRIIVGKSWECNWTLTLKEGQIVIEGPYLDSGDSVFAITGGTGQYAGAKGSMTLHPRDAKSTSYDFTYDLL